MGQVKKFNRLQAMSIICHCERTGATHKNKNIDMSRTHENYALWPPDNPDRLVLNTPVEGQSSGKYAFRRLEKRLSEVSYIHREDVNVLCDWILHLGIDALPGYENKRAFFEAAVRILADLYGPENVIFAWVHEDETTSHLHFGFVPVVKRKRRLRKNASEATRREYEKALSEGKEYIERVSAESVINRRHLQDWHGYMTKRMTEELGYDPGIFTGITEYLGGNAHVESLKKAPPGWVKHRNARVNAFHTMRRALAQGETVPLDVQIAVSDPGNKNIQGGPGRKLELDVMMQIAKGKTQGNK